MKILNRFEALLLIPCLFADPMAANGIAHGLSFSTLKRNHISLQITSILAEEALNPALVDSQFPGREGGFQPKTRAHLVEWQQPTRYHAGNTAFAGVPLTWKNYGLDLKLFGVYTRFHWSTIPAVFLLARSNALALSAVFSGPIAWSVGIISGVFLLFIGLWPHEKAHAWAAQRLGVPVKDILITGVGGLTRLESGNFPSAASDEFKFIYPGPLASLAIGALSLIAVYAIPDDGALTWDLMRYFFKEVTWVSFVVGGSNLAPVYPLDGGKLLRSVLWNRLGKQKATAVVVRLSHVAAAGSLLWASYRFAYMNDKFAMIYYILALLLAQMATEEGKKVGLTISWKPRHWKRYFAIVASIGVSIMTAVGFQGSQDLMDRLPGGIMFFLLGATFFAAMFFILKMRWDQITVSSEEDTSLEIDQAIDQRPQRAIPRAKLAKMYLAAFFPDKPLSLVLSLIILFVPEASQPLKVTAAVLMSFVLQHLTFWIGRLFYFRQLSLRNKRLFARTHAGWWAFNVLLGTGYFIYKSFSEPSDMSLISVSETLLSFMMTIYVGFNLVSLFLYRLFYRGSLLGAVFGKNSYRAPLGGALGVELKRVFRAA